MFTVLILPAYKWLLPFAADVLITIKQTAGTRRRRPQLSIYISCPQGAQQQTSRRPLLLSIYGTGGQTDRQPTVTWTLLRIPSGHRHSSTSNAMPHLS